MMVPHADWPFLLLSNAAGDQVGWALLNAPLASAGHRRQLAELLAHSYRLGGMSSHLSFPRPDGRDPVDYVALCEAWCHCFREPDRYLGADIPRTLLALSDFTDYEQLRPAALGNPAGAVKAFDFLYVGGEFPWKRRVKGWDLAVPCIRRLAAAGLRGVVVQGEAPELAGVTEVTVAPKLPRREFLSLLLRTRLLLAASEEDPSPRILAEALCLDVPILVYEGILGGWHYVNETTGAFFSGEEDVLEAAENCLGPGMTPRAWYAAHHGPLQAGRRLLELLSSVDPSIRETSHLTLTWNICEPW